MYGDVVLETTDAQTKGRADVFKYELRKPQQEFIEKFLAGDPAFKNRVRVLTISGFVTNGRANTIFAGYGYDVVDGAEIRKPNWAWDVVAGIPLYQSQNPSGVVVGRGLGQILGCTATTKEKYFAPKGGYIPMERPFACGQPEIQLNVSTEAGQLNALDVTVVGIRDAAFKELDNKYLLMPLGMAQQLYDTDGLSFITVQLKENSNVGAFVERFNTAATQSGQKITASPWQSHPFGDMYLRSVELLSIFRNFVVAVIISIAGLSVFNSLIKIVKERTREIGALRSIGFFQNQIVLMFGLEACFLALLGNFLGFVATLLVTGVINSTGIMYKAGMLAEPIPFRIAVVPSVYIDSLVFLCCVSILAALVPSFSISRKKIAETLVDV